jgi:hypothetical protein
MASPWFLRGVREARGEGIDQVVRLSDQHSDPGGLGGRARGLRHCGGRRVCLLKLAALDQSDRSGELALEF